MKTLVTIRNVTASECGTGLIWVLTRLAQVPQLTPGLAFDVTLPVDDPRLREIENVLSKHGLSPWRDKTRRREAGREYYFGYSRQYDSADFAACEYLQLEANVRTVVERSGLGEVGNLYRIEPRDIVPDTDFVSGGNGQTPVLVPPRTATVLNQANIVGLKLLPVLLVEARTYQDGTAYSEVPWASVGEPWYQLSATKEMPPVSPYLKRISGRHLEPDPLPRIARHGPTIEEGFADVELHYLRSELERMGAFDIARLYESVGEGPFIVSKKFYETCVQAGLKSGWRPVRVDEA